MKRWPLLFCLAGCVTSSEGDKMRQEIHDLQTRMDKRETETAEKVAKLDDSLAEATKVLGQTGANVGSQVADLQSKLADLVGQLAEARHIADELKKSFDDFHASENARLGDLEARVDKMAKPPAPTIPDDKVGLYEDAYKKFSAGQNADARKEFQLYIQRFPEDDKADNAQFWIAESYYNDKDFARAIGEYQKVIDRYPKGDAVDGAYFKDGLSAYQMKWCTDARAYLEALVKKFPKSTMVGDAKAKLKELDRAQKNKKLCTS
jgi:tol-pal system protein YbgF